MPMLVSHLVLSNMRVYKTRTVLTIAAIAMSVALIVSVTSGYSSVYAAAHRSLARFMGSTDAQIIRANELHGGIKDDLIAQLESDPDVYQVDGRLEASTTLIDAAGVTRYWDLPVVGVVLPRDVGVQRLALEKGRWFDSSSGAAETVIDQITEEELKFKLGDQITLPMLDRRLTVTIVGIVHKPKLLGATSHIAYVPLAMLQKLVRPESPQQVSRVLIDLRPGSDQEAFASRWQQKLTAIDPNLNLQLSSENRRKLEEGLQGVHALSYLGGSVSLIAAMFITFSALSMGVSERQRMLGTLRAIGAWRMQLAKLVLFEGFILAALGVAVGVPLGILGIHLLAWKFSTILNAGAAISWGGLAFATIGAIVTALAASLLPALGAARVSPLDAMTLLARPQRRFTVFIAAIAGLLLICVDPFIFWAPLDRNIKFYSHFALGLPCVLIGFFLLAPLLVMLIEFILGPLIAAMFGVPMGLLRQQLSSGIWRSAGTAAAMMVGLAILIVTQTQGTTAIEGWKLPTRFPDLMIYSISGLTPSDQQKLANIPGIRKDQFMPIAIASPEFGSSIFAIAGAVAMPNATMFFGMDTDKVLDMMELDFRAGSQEEARQMLKKGKHLIVTEEYRQLKGLGVGDKLALKTNKGVVEFTIAGVVWSPGVDVIASVNDLGRQFTQRTAASVFGTMDDAREYFGIETIHFFAVNMESSIDKAKLLHQITTTLGKQGLNIGDVREMKHRIQKSFYELLLLVSTVSYAAMAVASLGVTNTIMTSVRTRRWHFGVLRSIGVTQGQLLRLVLAEAVLLGIVSIGLGFGAGFELAMDARQSWGVFFGYAPPMVVPWGTIGIGALVVMIVSLLASFWPAAHVARSEPLVLLQAGRASA